MKKILITGANSYVGVSVETYLNRWKDDFQVDTVDMIGDGWREASFHGYDVVFHVAGIVHQEQTKNDPAQAELYDRVNARLPVETAQKAKAEGVSQFVFMSSASVYGLTAPMGKVVMITGDTPLCPNENYGISKARAEEGLHRLSGEHFKIAILRPPMIYGKGCKGNYGTLAKLAKRLPVFPAVANQRSMIYMENLAEFVRQIILDQAEGIFCPQNREYVSTCDLVKQIAQANGKKILILPGLSWAVRLLRPVTQMVDKAFGSLCYDFELSRYSRDYCVKSLAESIIETES